MDELFKLRRLVQVLYGERAGMSIHFTGSSVRIVVHDGDEEVMMRNIPGVHNMHDLLTSSLYIDLCGHLTTRARAQQKALQDQVAEIEELLK